MAFLTSQNAFLKAHNPLTKAADRCQTVVCADKTCANVGRQKISHGPHFEPSARLVSEQADGSLPSQLAPLQQPQNLSSQDARLLRGLLEEAVQACMHSGELPRLSGYQVLLLVCCATQCIAYFELLCFTG